jgi:putative transposase
LLTEHPTWQALGSTDNARRQAYRNLFKETLDQKQLDALRYGVRKGLPTGHKRFKRQIENSLSIQLRDGRIGRPARKV